MRLVRVSLHEFRTIYFKLLQSVTNMSDNESCLFCKIVRGEIPASVIFEDKFTMAFMDIFPISKGHCLLIPKQHYVNMLDVDAKIAKRLGARLAELNRKVHSAFEPDGIINVIANGVGAGQEVPHLHMHVIPRNEGDRFGFMFPDDYREEMAPRDELDSVAKTIRTSTDLLGSK